jgi:hypothetical protein
MGIVYLETSSLLRVLFRQASYTEIAEFVEKSEVVVTSAITSLEARRAISRAQTDGDIREGDAQSLRGVLAEQEDTWQVVELTQRIRARAGEAFPLEPVRALDAVHLASILEFKAIYPDLCVCSVDDRVVKNLRPLGVAGWR